MEDEGKWAEQKTEVKSERRGWESEESEKEKAGSTSENNRGLKTRPPPWEESQYRAGVVNY